MHLASLRALIRRLGLQRLVLPFVEWMENRRLRRIGTYSVLLDDRNDVVLTGFDRKLFLRGLPQVQCELALSPHERPTITVVLSRVAAGGVAWDVGANVGLYSQLMSEAVGVAGRVIAFEPNIATFLQLQANVSRRVNVTLLPCGLGSKDGTVQMATPADHSSASRVVISGDVPLDDMSTITIARGDTLLDSAQAPQPNFLKIDVEGHELETLRGLDKVLKSSECRCVLVEVHFALLERGGYANAPAEIARLLALGGLTKQLWIGRSHLLAERP